MLLIGIAGSSMNGYAQRAKKHREGILNIDSIRAQNAADSIALLDTLQLQRQRSYLLETAVDTAALIQESDSIQQQNLNLYGLL